MISIMRGAVKGAGNPKKLQLIVKCADPPATYETILDRYGSRAPKAVGRRGGETHLLFAKALGFLDYRNVPTIDAGKTLLVLCDVTDVPKEFLLMQLLRKDRSFLIPFLASFVASGDTSAKAGKHASQVLEELWKEHADELDAIGFQRDQHQSESALSHFVNPRLALLRKIGLRDADSQERLVKEFKNFECETMPDNAYYLIARAVHRREPMNFLSESMVTQAYWKLKGISYASIVGLYDYLNQLTVPNTFVDYGRLFHFLRNSEKFTLHPLETLREGMFRVV